jgi:hypothetical protein
MSCHDLTSTIKPPKNFKALLGLGLNFCPTPRYTTYDLKKTLERLQNNLYNHYLYHRESEKEKKFDPRYHIVSTNFPDWWRVHLEIRARYVLFKTKLKSIFKKRRARSNLLRHQTDLLRFLIKQDQLIICSTDKNLGPCIIERERYVNIAFDDHLSNEDNYKQLTESEAHAKINDTRIKIDKLIITHGNIFTRQQKEYIQHFLIGDEEKLIPHFYLTMKVHKKNLGSRPIISLSGTALYGLGVWLNNELQPLIKKVDSYVSSSRSFKDEILQQQPFGPKARFFTADAVGMYNNIDTKHALKEIKNFFQTHPLCFLLNWKPLYAALEIIMTCNVFQFSDYFFLQISGCSMGTPPAPPYAILYFAIKELELALYKLWLRLYKRYIDDVEGVWLLDDDTLKDGNTWQSFKDCMNNYGILKWKFMDI